ncbi:Tetraspanin-3-like [Oopsacas minuta]|uniref:Tetraspanin n=1 Tax=Oopsacas minuta TaxID=111878 RepID=A0AAV7K1W8_9METZ|nr:Tetraspanin-3-like [Oopsacas minuta]
MKSMSVLLKAYLIFFNIFLCIVSIALLAGIAYYFYAADQYKGVADDRDVLVYTVVPLVILIVVAIMLFLLSILGIISACLDVKPLLLLYGVLLACVVLAQVIGGGLVIGFKDTVLKELSNGFIENIPTYSSSDAFRESVDYIQTQLQCCGVNSYTDWVKNGVLVIPQSCCKSNSGCVPVLPFIYTEGCIDKISGVLTKSAAITISVAIVLALIQLSGVVVAFIICGNKKRQYGSVIQYVRIAPLPK